MNSKEYKFSDGRTAVFEYDENGIGKITLECMDALMGMITQQWIPVSERLPKEEGVYPVVINGTDPVLSVKYEQGFAMGYFAPIDEAWEIDGHEDLINDLEVLAWMQLPPYTENES